MTAKILVVDDDATMLRYYELLLGRWDWQATTAASAQEAMNKAHDSKPDLILTDLVMPHANGLDLLRWLQADPSLRDVPVIALSAGITDRDNPVLRDFDEVLVKPLSGLQLAGTIDRVLREHSACGLDKPAWPVGESVPRVTHLEGTP